MPDGSVPRVFPPLGTTGVESPHLARKPNYNFEKQRRESQKKAKKEARREEKLRRKQEVTAEKPPLGIDDEARASSE